MSHQAGHTVRMAGFQIGVAFRRDQEGRLLCDATNMRGRRESVTFEIGEPPDAPLAIEAAEARAARRDGEGAALLMVGVLVAIVIAWPVQALTVAAVAGILWLVFRYPMLVLLAMLGGTLGG